MTQRGHHYLEPLVILNQVLEIGRIPDKVLYKEIMTNDDNLESNPLTSNLLKLLVQVLLQAEPQIPRCEVGTAGELLIFI